MVETATWSVTTSPTASIRATAVAEARRGFLTELLVASLTVEPMNPRSHPNRRSSTGT